MMSNWRIGGAKIFLFFTVLYAALFNLETSPFKYIIPSLPFSECLNNRLDEDTYVYLYGGNLITHGLVPYRDYFDHKGPLVYLIMAGGILIGKVAGVWLIQTSFLVVSAIYAYKTASFFVSQWASALAAGFLVQWYTRGGTRPETLSIPFLLITLFYLVRYLTNGYQIRKRETLLVGLAFGSVLFMKANLTALWMVFIVTVILASLRKRQYFPLLRRALVFLAGAALICVPILCWLWIEDAFPDFVKDYWIFNIYHYGGGGPKPNNYLLFFLPQLHRLSFFGWIHYFGFNVLALFVYGLLSFLKKAPSQKYLYASLATYLLLQIFLIGMKGEFYLYYVFPLSVAYLVFIAWSFDFALKRFPKHWMVGILIFAVLSIPFLRSMCPSIALDWAKTLFLATHSPSINYESVWLSKTNGQMLELAEHRSLLGLAEWIKENTDKDCKINGGEPSVYWYANRFCASPCFLPRLAIKSYDLTFPRDERGNLPEYIFEERAWEITSEIKQTLADEYNLVFQNDHVDLYRLKNKQ